MYRTAVFVGLLVTLARVAQADVVLYDGSVNTTPGSQGWLYLTNPLTGSGATQTAANGATTLDTTANQASQAGYFSTTLAAMPTLNSSTGWTVSIDARIMLESHSNTNRSGFSLIVLDSVHRGIELEFWSDQVWAQSDNPLFTHSETAFLDTTQARNRYSLSVLSNNYQLYQGGQLILSSATRDYSSFGAPYTSTNFLFFGDNSASSLSRTEIARVAFDLSAIPEPTSVWLLAIGLPVALFGLQWKDRKD